MSCVFRGAVRHTRRARGSSRTHRVVSTEVLASGLRFPQRIHPGDKRSQTRCVRPREAVEVSEAAAEDSAVVARREAEGDSAAAAAAAAAAASTKDLRIPSSVRDVRPARVVPRVSARARTQREHAPNCWFTLGFVVAGFFPPGRRWCSSLVRSSASPPLFPSSAEVGEFMHACEGEAVCKLTNAKVRSLRLQPRAPFRARKSAPPTGRPSREPPGKRTSAATASAAAVSLPLHLRESNPR